MFEVLTALLPIVDVTYPGAFAETFLETTQAFFYEHPDYYDHEFLETLSRNRIPFGNAMAAVDVSRFDGRLIIAMIQGLRLGEKQGGPGIIEGFVKIGAVARWLERLKEIDDKTG